MIGRRALPRSDGCERGHDEDGIVARVDARNR